MSGYSNAGGQAHQMHQMSAEAQMREGLLHGDMGEIDISKEVPLSMQRGDSAGEQMQGNASFQQSPQQYAQQQQYQQQQYQQQQQQQSPMYGNNQGSQMYNSPPQQQMYSSPQQQMPQQQMPQQQMGQQQMPQQQMGQQQGYISPQQQRYTSPQQQRFTSPQQQKPYQRMQNYRNNQQMAAQHKKPQQAPQQEKKGFGNFFKGKGHQIGFNMGKLGAMGNSSRSNLRLGHGGGGGGGGGSDDEDGGDIVLDEPDSAIMTFDDITTITYKKGDKLGIVGDSTAPIIPTIVTKEGGNMNNTEYRKFMTNQKKTAYTAAAKHNQMMQQGGPQNMGPGMNPRAMSLQTNQNPYMQQQQQGPNPMYNSGNNGSMTNVRANTMTGGQPPRFMQMQGQPGGPGGNPQQPQMNRGPMNGNMQQMGGQVPPQHTMSLTSGSRPNMGNMNYQGGMQNNVAQGGMPRNGSPGGMQINGSPGNMQPRDPNMMMQMGQQNFNANPNDDQYRTMSLQNNPMSRTQFQRDMNDSAHPSSTSSVPTTASSELNYHIGGTSTTSSSSDHIKSPLSKKVDWPEQPNVSTPQIDPSQSEPKAKLNVLQLSKPQQDELQERESQLSQRERDLIARERAIQEREAKAKQEPKIIAAEPAPAVPAPAPDSDDLNLRPTSLLESGLKSLSLDENGRSTHDNRESATTYMSSFSNSPAQNRASGAQQGGLYQLQNSSDGKEFVTAQDLHKRESFKSDEPETSSLTKTTTVNTVVEPSVNHLAIVESHTSTIRDEKRESQMSATTAVKAQLAGMGSNMDDTFEYKQDEGPVATEPLVLPTNDKPADILPTTLTSSKQEDDDFDFDNTRDPVYVDTADRSIKAIHITPEQLSILGQNKSLMRELTLMSSELGESIKREAILSEKLRSTEKSNPFNVAKAESTISLADFEDELRKKSSKILELIQSVNAERLKRFVAEEQVLLSEVNARPSTIELMEKIVELKDTIKSKDEELHGLREKLSEQ